MHLGVWGSRYNKRKEKKERKIYTCYFITIIRNQSNQYFISTNCCLLLIAWNMYLEITLESFLFLSPANVINGVLHASQRNCLRRSLVRDICRQNAVHFQCSLYKKDTFFTWDCHYMCSNYYLWAILSLIWM